VQALEKHRSWRWRVDPAGHAELVSAIQSSSGLSASYLTLLVLSCLIATFGLLSNSTATVIGAMIVAPLMGPILGSSLALVRGDLPGFRSALIAEVLGIALCLTVSVAVLVLVGAKHVDFSLSEIAGRVRPTLLDLAVGFSAGLAGAYCTANRQISSSIAGVAIAVALVPPLCVSGLCLGAGLHKEAFGAFVLFGANFLTIQLAATIVFTICGLGQWSKVRGEMTLLHAILLNVVLLGLTGWFLTGQLRSLIAERRAEKVAHDVVSERLSQISGATLESLKVQLSGSRLRVSVLAGAPEEIGVGVAQALRRELKERLSYDVDLRIGTALTSFVTPEGRLFDGTDQLQKATGLAIQSSLQGFPGVELLGFQRSEVTPSSQNLVISVRSPYVLDAPMVAQLQTSILSKLAARQPEQKRVQVTVRTTLIQDYTAEGLQDVPSEQAENPEQARRFELERRAQEFLDKQLKSLRDASVTEIHVQVRLSSLDLTVKIQSLTAIPDRLLASWKQGLQTELASPLSLKITNVLGRVVQLPVGAASEPASRQPAPLLAPEPSATPS
jgi:uncharacterized hydrophobic protein (TIGR00271 family)